ncbi:MAG: hypothetical protein JW727_01090 [Candidatus Aenigmarchaeota archaeon]|nr:hypothetical protein [Candidatus Aenigmarchaeota archaeon]
MAADKKKERWVYVCPKCGSKDIAIRSWDIAFNEKICSRCGYTSQFFPQVPLKARKKQAGEIKKRPSPKGKL